jgi:hypothetical protein
MAKMAGKSICFSAYHKLKLSRTARKFAHDGCANRGMELLQALLRKRDEGEADAAPFCSLQCLMALIARLRGVLNAPPDDARAESKLAEYYARGPRAASRPEERRVNPVTWCPVLLFCI